MKIYWSLVNGKKHVLQSFFVLFFKFYLPPELRTSLFIVGSSTYAQLLIVICIVAALSEVVTHNVPFNYFEVSVNSLQSPQKTSFEL